VNASNNSTPTDSQTPRKQKTSIKGIPDPSVTIRPIPIERLDLSSKKLAVVGGTNGLGRAIAQQALARGAEVTVVGANIPRRPGRPADVRGSRSVLDETGRPCGPRTPGGILRPCAVHHRNHPPPRPAKRHPNMSNATWRSATLSRLAILQGLSPRLGSARDADAPRPRVFIMGSPGTGEIGNPDDLNSETNYQALVAHGNTLAGNEILVLGAKDRFPGPAFFGLGPYPRQNRHPQQPLG